MYPPARVPSLAQRAIELHAVRLPGAIISLHAGRELHYEFLMAPSVFGRLYKCRLRIRPDSQTPDMLVLAPDLVLLSGGDRPPHIYPHRGPGTKLCLWWPKRREWIPQLKLAETYLPWTAEWLWYFEDWLTTRVWAGGGEHPQLRSRHRAALRVLRPR